MLYTIMKNTFSYFIIILFLFSCQENNKIRTKLSDSGNVIEKRVFDNNGKLLKVIEYYDIKESPEYKITFKNTDYDSVVYKYDNGEVFKTGKLNLNSQVLGTWNLFDKKGNKREIREFYIYENKPILNRAWFLNEKGDTLAWREEENIFDQKEFVNDTLAVRNSSYIFFEFNKDTVDINEPIRGIAYCFSPRLREYGSEIRVYLDTEKEKFNSDFSNEDDILTQGYHNLERDTINQKWFPDLDKEDLKYVAVFGSWFEKPGPKILRGYMEEYAIGPFKDKTSDSITARTFFEKKVFVRDTVE